MSQASEIGTGRARTIAGSKVENEPIHAGFPQDLLVYQDEGAASENALEYASSLAKGFGGRVTALMISAINIQAGIFGDSAATAWVAAQQQAAKEEAELEKRLRSRLSKLAPHADFQKTETFGGDGSNKLTEFSPCVDAVVLGWAAGSGAGDQRAMFKAALFHSGRPVIVVPEKARNRGAPAKILVAWTPRKEAARALHDAMPLLCNAKEVKVVLVEESHNELGKHAGTDIAAHLARHGVRAEVRRVPKAGLGTARTLLEEARFFGADLMVMGGYGHSRLREWMLGGATHDVLASADVPVFFSH